MKSTKLILIVFSYIIVLGNTTKTVLQEILDIENKESQKLEKLENFKEIKIENYSCNIDLECNNGNCFENQCNCFIGYLTTINDKTSCTYKQKLQSTAFCLELFLGFGIGHYYSGRNLHATLKLFAMIFGIFMIMLYPITMKCVDEKLFGDAYFFLTSFLFYLIAVSLAFLIVYDLIMFGLNKYKDGKGIPLFGWTDKN